MMFGDCQESTMCSSSTHPQPVGEDCIVSHIDAHPKSVECYHSEGPENQNSFVSDIQLKRQQRASLGRQITINELPEELLLTIFSYMSIVDLIYVVQNVCTYWRKLAHDPHLWYESVYYIWPEESDEEVIKTLKMTPELSTIMFNRTATEAVFSAISENCHKLTELDIFYKQPLNPSDVKHLFESCNKIQVLSIPKLFSLDTGFPEALANLKGLRALELKQNERGKTKLDLHKLADMLPHLCEIHLWLVDCNFDDLECFIKAKKNVLKRVTLKWLSDTGRCTVPLLTLCAASLEYLKINDIGYNALSQEGFVALCQLNNLRKLIMDTWGPPVKNTFSVPFRSGGLSKLQSLELSGFAINNEAVLAVCQGCPELCELNLKSCSVTDAGCVLLHLLKQLKKLTVASCKKLCGKVISEIAKLPALERLYIHYLKFESLEPGLEHIIHMSNLRSLSLLGCTTRDVPFHKFPENLINLRELHLDFCEGSETGLQEMCRKMPELKVYGIDDD